jgi:hypothetical protein
MLHYGTLSNVMITIGPDKWYLEDIRCSGGSQSPISLADPLDVNNPPTYDSDLTNITYNYYDDTRTASGTLTSSANYLSLQSLSRYISVMDGPFDGQYDLVKIDFHTPSEHKIAEYSHTYTVMSSLHRLRPCATRKCVHVMLYSRLFELEVQLYFLNNDTSEQSDTSLDQLAIISIFFAEVADDDSNTLESSNFLAPIATSLANVRTSILAAGGDWPTANLTIRWHLYYICRLYYYT